MPSTPPPPGNKGTQSAFYIEVAGFHFITVWTGRHASGAPAVYFIYSKKGTYAACLRQSLFEAFTGWSYTVCKTFSPSVL